MAALATAADVAAMWRPLTAEETTQAATLVDYASAVVRARFPDVDARVAAGSLDAALPRLVVASMVKRAMLAGGLEGVKRDVVGPFQTEAFNPEGALYLTGAELAWLVPAAAPRARSVWLS